MLRESGIQKIIAWTDERNTASIRVLEKTDFRQDKHETVMYELRGEQVKDLCYVWMETQENGTQGRVPF